MSRRFRRWRRFLFVGGSCPTDFTDIHRFSSSEGFSSDFIDESEGILAYRITHGFSQIFGRWPMAGARSSPLLFFVTQISQMTQIFLRGRALSHRFHRFTQILDLFGLWIKRHADFADFFVWIFGGFSSRLWQE